MISLTHSTYIRVNIHGFRHTTQRNTSISKGFVTSSVHLRAIPLAPKHLKPGVSSTDSNVDNGKALRMIMFGKPGAGKGTLTSRLVKKYDIMSLTTGDLLRQHIVEGTEVGKEAEGIVAQGGLLPDPVVLRVVTSKLRQLPRTSHWILDGFPRTLGQGELLDIYLRNDNLPLTLIVNLDVADEVILARISDRWIHLPSGRVYNLSYNKPKVQGRDDVTGEPLIRRPDDNPEVFSRRLNQFYKSTSPLLQYYELRSSTPGQRTRVVTLSGKTSDEIWPQLERVVLSHFPVRVREEWTREQRGETMKRAQLSSSTLSRHNEFTTRNK